MLINLALFQNLGIGHQEKDRNRRHKISNPGAPLFHDELRLPRQTINDINRSQNCQGGHSSTGIPVRAIKHSIFSNRYSGFEFKLHYICIFTKAINNCKVISQLKLSKVIIIHG